jgi:Peptidase family M28
MSQAFPIDTQDSAAKAGRSYAAWLRPDYLIALISFSILAFFIFLSTLETAPPAAVPSSAPLTEFSSGRAMQRLGIIAQKPRPPGSAEHSAVRDYIVREVSAMGLKPEIQKTAQSDIRHSLVIGAIVENIFVKLPGTRTGGKSVLLSAHYDTVQHSSGASDDGAGVATLLETLRTLRVGQPLANDIIFLFTDIEEMALLGAKAFVEKHPAAKDVKIAFNFDALGKSGASVMYETSENNGWLVGEFAKAAPNPVANSLAADIYRRMRFVTDFTVLARGDVQGLNFAYLQGAHAHHNQLDNLDTIDERSVQHNGSYALALARHFGNIDLETGTSRNSVFFSVLGSFLVHYPTNWAIPLAIAVFALFIAVVVIGLRKKRLTIGGMALGLFAFLFSVIASASIVSIIQKVAGLMPKDSLFLGNPDPYNSSLYILGFVALAIAVISTLYIWFRKKTSIDNLVVGAMFPWLILTVYTGFALPVGSYLFTWPLLFVLIAQGVDFVVRKNETNPLKLSVGLSISTFPAIALIVPMVYFCFLVLSFQLSPRITALFIAMAMLPVGLLISQIDFMLRPKNWLLPATAVLVGITFISVAKFTSQFDRHNRMTSSLFHAVNANAGKAIWASLNVRPDEWTSQFLTGSTERMSAIDFAGHPLSVLSAEAPVLSSSAPEMKVISDTTTNGIRSLNLRITSTRQAPFIMVTLNPETNVRAFTLDGKRYDNSPKNDWTMYYLAAPAEGIELALELEQPRNVALRVTDYLPGLPEVPGASFKPRPDYLMASSETFNDGSVITKLFAL